MHDFGLYEVLEIDYAHDKYTHPDAPPGPWTLVLVQLLSAQEKEWLPIMMTEVIETLKPGRDPASHL